ncbi:MAG: hypothetical protein GWP09_02340, partial [Nitrospiraceae bacterium]|nr:hypothetical protein [Nitrospiraceae bacterium]
KYLLMNKDRVWDFVILGIVVLITIAIGYLYINSNQKSQKFTPIQFNIINNLSNDSNVSCTPNIVCFNWSNCHTNNLRYRECFDVNACKSYNFTQSQKCDYFVEEHCKDNIKDYDETDIDCGGSCAPCDIGEKCSLNKDCGRNICNPTSKTCVKKLTLYEKIQLFSKTNLYLFSFLLLLTPTLLLLIPFFVALYYSQKREKEKKKDEALITFRGYVKLFYKYLKLNEFSRSKDAYFKALDALRQSKKEIPKSIYDEVKVMRNDFKDMIKENSKDIDTKDNIPKDEFNFDSDDLNSYK